MTRCIIDGVAAAAVILTVAALFLASASGAARAETARAPDALACQPVKVSWYGNEHHGRRTASGEVFDQWGLSAAMMGRQHLGERWRITHGGRSVVVRITDTGDFAKYGRFMDLSRGAFARLADTDAGVIRVCVERLK